MRIVVDCHCDFLVDVIRRYINGELDTLVRRHLPRFQIAGVNVIFCPFAGDSNTFTSDTATALKYLEIAKKAVGMAGDKFALVSSGADLKKSVQEGKIALLLGFEGAKPLRGDLELLEAFYELGVRWIGLTWNGRNEVGDGVGVSSDRGLTPVGKKFVKAMQELGLIIDLSHASKRTFYDVLETVDCPVIVSHSNSWSLCPHPRNITDDQIIQIARRKGVIGVNFFPALLARDRAPTIRDVVMHISYLRDIVGIEYIAIGPDFIDYADDIFARSLAESTVDYGPTLRYPEGLEDVTKLPNLRATLAEEGFSQTEIDKIFGLNAMRVIDQLLR